MKHFHSDHSESELRLALTTFDSAAAALPEVIARWGWKHTHDTRILLNGTQMEWNHRVSGFVLYENGTVCALVYWQGEGTDGTEYLSMDSVVAALRGEEAELVIPAEWDDVGGCLGTILRHGPIRITRDEIAEAFRAVAEYVSPKAVLERESLREAKRRREMLDWRIYHLVLQPKIISGENPVFRLPEPLANGRAAVRAAAEKHFEDLERMSDSLLKKTLEGVYNKNACYDDELQRTPYGAVAYDIAI